jgi:hypothetical protein
VAVHVWTLVELGDVDLHARRLADPAEILDALALNDDFEELLALRAYGYLR